MALLLAGATTARATLAVWPIDGAVPAEQRAALETALVAAVVEGTHVDAVAGPDRSALALRKTGGDVAAAVHLLGASHCFVAHLVSVADGQAVGLTLMDHDGVVLARAREPVLDLDDPPFAHLVKTVWRESNKASASTPPAIEWITGLRTGLVLPFAPNIDLEPQVALHFDGWLTGRRWFAWLGAGMALPVGGEDAFGYGSTYLRLGGGAFFTEGANAPFAGLAARPGVVFSEGESAASVALAASAGYLIGRDAPTRGFIDLEIGWQASGIDPQPLETQGTARATDTLRPIELGLHVGIGW
ncbi:MAG: hypothetical protein KC620_25000 [Myxococcales bacterium]|nr:hypothetical protein [Myxococcales bacterium]